MYVHLAHILVFPQMFGDPLLCAHVKCGEENKMVEAPCGDWALLADDSL